MGLKYLMNDKLNFYAIKFAASFFNWNVSLGG